MGTYRLRLTLGMCFICALILGISPIPNQATQKIVLIGSNDTKNSFHGRWLSLIYTEVFLRLGYKLYYDGYPSARASRISDAGKVDGEINRVTSYQETHPNMIRVDESHFPTTLAAYAVKPGIAIDGWKGLENTDYIVGYRRGTKIVEVGLKTVVEPKNLLSVTSTKQGLKILIIGRMDIYVDVEDTVTEILGRLDPVKFDPSSVHNVGTMAKSNLHTYLHKKNAELVPKIAEVLKAMKKEGLIEQYKKYAMEKQ